MGDVDSWWLMAAVCVVIWCVGGDNMMALLSVTVCGVVVGCCWWICVISQLVVGFLVCIIYMVSSFDIF